MNTILLLGKLLLSKRKAFKKLKNNKF